MEQNIFNFDNKLYKEQDYDYGNIEYKHKLIIINE